MPNKQKVQKNMPKPVEKPMMPAKPVARESFWHKHLVAELILILIATAGIWIVYYIRANPPVVEPQPILRSSTGGNTANWKTYTNTDIGFQFKYPSNWEIQSYPDSMEFISPQTKAGIEKLSEGAADFGFTWGPSHVKTATPGTVKTETINGHAFTTYSGGPIETGNYEIKSGLTILDFQGKPAVVKSILSTFKFTK